MSSGDVGADVKITLTADDQASNTIDSATKSINSSYRSMLQQQNAVGRSYLVNNQNVFALGRAMQSTGRIVDRSISLFNSYNLMQIRIEQATTAAADSQEHLAQVIAQYGANSIQAQTAAKENQRALEAQKKASDEARVQFALMVASAVAQSGTMITTVIPRLLALSNAIKGISIAAGISGAVGAASAGGVGAGSLAGGGIAGALGRAGGIAVRAAGPAAIGVSLLSMMGQQTAGENDLPSGLTQLQNVFNIIVQDAGAAANTVKDEIGKVLSFGGGPP